MTLSRMMLLTFFRNKYRFPDPSTDFKLRVGFRLKRVSEAVVVGPGSSSSSITCLLNLRPEVDVIGEEEEWSSKEQEMKRQRFVYEKEEEEEVLGGSR